MFPLLNHLELSRLASLLDRECAGAHVERLIIPERSEFPEGYLKSEWVLRLQSRRRDLALFVSVRPRACSVSLAEGKGPKHAPESTRSPFDQALAKHLKGARLIGIRAIDRERMLVLEFSGLLLILVLIPALPEAFLVDSEALEIIARSRTIRDEAKQRVRWTWPESREIPQTLSVREELFSSSFRYHEVVEEALRAQAFQVRLDRARRAITELANALTKSVRQSEQAIAAAEKEPDWTLFGETLKAWLYALPEPVGNFWQLGDVQVPLNAKAAGGTGKAGSEASLTPSQLVERYFQLAKRKKRRREEAQSRLKSARERLAKVDPKREMAAGDWRALADFERLAGLAGSAGGERGAGAAALEGGARLKVSVPSAWQGKVFISKDGFPILVGKSRDENLELTFRIARGNDLWMHVRGRPGAHVVIPVPTGKTVPLETLLDAAALCIALSGGKSWGKTEVDYTLKKYVKRIKDSTEASYTNNRTLIATPDEERLGRLGAQ